MDIATIKSPPGFRENAANSIAKERENGIFLTKDELRIRCKVSKTVIEIIKTHVFKGFARN
jgi:DNA polymerase-3 subunit alpha (Gram-positive type)